METIQPFNRIGDGDAGEIIESDTPPELKSIAALKGGSCSGRQDKTVKNPRPKDLGSQT